MAKPPSTLVVNPLWIRTVFAANGSVESVTNNFYGNYARFERRVVPWPSTVQPQWALRENNPKIWVPPTNHTVEITQRADGYGSRSIPASGNRKVVDTGFIHPNANVQASLYNLGELESGAIDQVLENLSGMSVNLAQAFAERKQTTGLMLSTANTLGSAFSDLLSGNYSRAINRLTRASRKRGRGGRGKRGGLWGPDGKPPELGSMSLKASEAWLQLQYGWKPLVSDVYNSAEALAAADMADPNRYLVSASGRRAKSLKNNLTAYYTGFKTVHEGVQRASARVKIYYSLPELGGLTRPLSTMGITNPALLAWELVPYSFVVDWFLPVGNYLQAINADMGLVWRGGSTSTMQFKRDSITWSRHGSVYTSYNATASPKYFRYSRSVLSATPRPNLRLAENPLSDVRIANAVALLRQIFSKDKIHPRVR